MKSINTFLRRFLMLCVALSSTSVFAELSPICQQLFDEAELLVLEAEKQPGKHPNLLNIREKLDAGRAKLLKLNPASQKESCDLGLAKLNHFYQTQDVIN